MPRDIAGPSSPRGYKYGTWSSRLEVEGGVGVKNCLIGNQKYGLGKVWRRSIIEAKACIGL